MKSISLRIEPKSVTACFRSCKRLRLFGRRTFGLDTARAEADGTITAEGLKLKGVEEQLSFRLFRRPELELEQLSGLSGRFTGEAGGDGSTDTFRGRRDTGE